MVPAFAEDPGGFRDNPGGYGTFSPRTEFVTGTEKYGSLWDRHVTPLLAMTESSGAVTHPTPFAHREERGSGTSVDQGF